MHSLEAKNLLDIKKYDKMRKNSLYDSYSY